MTSIERKERKIDMNKIRDIGLNFRLIDSYKSATEVIAYATTREELFNLVEKESCKREINKCDLITQEYNTETLMYNKNFYHTKPRDFIVDGRLVKGIRQNY